MLIYPALDLREGACVRLLHGRFDAVTNYGDPAAQLDWFAGAGAQWTHIVDLDGARLGWPAQHELIARLARGTTLKVQSGGGVREREHVQALLDAGVDRVVVGSAAVKRPDEVREWIAEAGIERVCCAFDVRPSGDSWEVAVHGWTASAGRSLFEALALFPPGALKHALVTDVSRDGAMTGPNVELNRELARMRPDICFQASGGVAQLEDISALREAGASGCIVGRALYERRFTLEAALAC